MGFDSTRGKADGIDLGMAGGIGIQDRISGYGQNVAITNKTGTEGAAFGAEQVLPRFADG